MSSSLDKSAARLLDKLSMPEPTADVELQATIAKIETVKYLNSLKEALDLGAIDEEEYEEQRAEALAKLRKKN
jgi:hypothetical protein